jgi:hypothetical protein
MDHENILSTEALIYLRNLILCSEKSPVKLNELHFMLGNNQIGYFLDDYSVPNSKRQSFLHALKLPIHLVAINFLSEYNSDFMVSINWELINNHESLNILKDLVCEFYTDEEEDYIVVPYSKISSWLENWNKELEEKKEKLTSLADKLTKDKTDSVAKKEQLFLQTHLYFLDIADHKKYTEDIQKFLKAYSKYFIFKDLLTLGIESAQTIKGILESYLPDSAFQDLISLNMPFEDQQELINDIIEIEKNPRPTLEKLRPKSLPGLPDYIYIGLDELTDKLGSNHRLLPDFYPFEMLLILEQKRKLRINSFTLEKSGIECEIELNEKYRSMYQYRKNAKKNDPPEEIGLFWGKFSLRNRVLKHADLTIENGHKFKLGDKPYQLIRMLFTDKDGNDFGYADPESVGLDKSDIHQLNYRINKKFTKKIIKLDDSGLVMLLTYD